MATIILLMIPRMFDVGSVDDSDLAPPLSPRVDPRENVVTEILRVHALLVEPEEYFDFELGSDDPETSDAERLHALVTANEAYYAELLPLLDRPHFVVSDPLSFEEMRPHVLAIRSASIWIGHRHASLVLRGKPQEAADLALRWAAAVRRHCEHVPSLVELLVALALYDASIQRLVASSQQDGLDQATLERLAAEAARPVDLFGAFEIAIRHEYRLARGVIDGLNSRYGSVARPFVFKPNRTRRELAKVTRACLEAVQTRDFTELTELEESFKQTNQLDLILSGNSVGRAIVGMLTPTYSLSLRKLSRRARNVNLFRTAIALRRYEVAQGQLPPSLDALAPEYLEASVFDPNDPMDYDPNLRWIGYEKPDELEPTPAPGIEVTPRLQ